MLDFFHPAGVRGPDWRPNKAVRYLVRLLTSVVLLPTLVLGGDDPFDGDWKLDAAKAAASKVHEIQSLHVEVNPTNLLMVRKWVSAGGEPAQSEIRARVDGSVSGVLDTPGIDSVRCWRAGARSLMLKLFEGGVAVGVWSAEVSKNGKVLKITFSTYDVSGKSTERTEFFERQ